RETAAVADVPALRAGDGPCEPETSGRGRQGAAGVRGAAAEGEGGSAVRVQRRGAGARRRGVAAQGSPRARGGGGRQALSAGRRPRRRAQVRRAARLVLPGPRVAGRGAAARRKGGRGGGGLPRRPEEASPQRAFTVRTEKGTGGAEEDAASGAGGA